MSVGTLPELYRNLTKEFQSVGTTEPQTSKGVPKIPGFLTDEQIDQVTASVELGNSLGRAVEVNKT